MRYLGNKTKLENFLVDNLVPYLPEDGSMFDMFSGTGSVAKMFKELGYKTYSTDILYFSYVLQEAYLGNTGMPSFNKSSKFSSYESALKYLNGLKPKHGYVYNTFADEGTKHLDQPRMFFTADNAGKIDAIRDELETLRSSKEVTDKEYYILLATLLEACSSVANITGVYAAFLKKFEKQAQKPITLKPIALTLEGKDATCYNKDGVLLLDVETDLYYLDPPYNARQYAPNYHVLETIARWDAPTAKGVTGMRDYGDLKSDFCNKVKALIVLDKIASEGKYKTLAMSYNSEGIMPTQDIIDVLSKYGTVKLVEKTYPRFKSHNVGDSATISEVKEQLFILERS